MCCKTKINVVILKPQSVLSDLLNCSCFREFHFTRLEAHVGHCQHQNLRWLDTVFFLDHIQHFQLTFYQPSLDLIDVKITPVFGKGIEAWLNTIFKVIDISMETIYQKLDIGKAWIFTKQNCYRTVDSEIARIKKSVLFRINKTFQAMLFV